MVRRALARTDSVFGADHWRAAFARFSLARLLLAANRQPEAQRLLTEAAPAYRERYVPPGLLRQRFDEVMREAGL